MLNSVVVVADVADVYAPCQHKSVVHIHLNVADIKRMYEGLKFLNYL